MDSPLRDMEKEFRLPEFQDEVVEVPKFVREFYEKSIENKKTVLMIPRKMGQIWFKNWFNKNYEEK